MQINLEAALLIVGVVNGLLIGSLLLMKSKHRIANSLLGCLILILVARVAIYLLGQSGVYDPHSWMYLPPVEVSLAYGPLIYLYLRSLTQNRLPKAWWGHLLPFIIQCSYYIVLLGLPLRFSIEWAKNMHFYLVYRIETTAVIASMSIYLYFSWHHLKQYYAWLLTQKSDVENFKLPWLHFFLAACSGSLIIWIYFNIKSMWVQFNYQNHFFLYAAQSLFLLVLALESWRHSGLVLPRMPQTVIPFLKQSIEGNHNRDNHKSQELANRWLTQIEAQEWWREPNLTLQNLARYLGTNTTTLSQALNKGHGANFNTVINRMRTREVCRQIDTGAVTGELLAVAFDAGFNSKNSFNRNFKCFTGLTPSQYCQKKRVKS